MKIAALYARVSTTKQQLNENIASQIAALKDYATRHDYQISLGMAMALQSPWDSWAPRPHVFKPPIFLVTAWEWLRQKLGYRRNDFDSSFGGVIPHSSG